MLLKSIRIDGFDMRRVQTCIIGYFLIPFKTGGWTELLVTLVENDEPRAV